MLSNPNAIAAAIGYGAAMVTQWLVQRYAHVALSDYWKQAVNGATVVAVLYVGKNGVKAALQRIWNGPKKLWAGTSSPAPPAK